MFKNNKIMIHLKRYNLFIIILITFFSIISVNLKAQLTVNGAGLTADSLVKKLLGKGVQYQNASYTGAIAARGFFNGVNCNVGLDSGVILTSGRIDFAVGPNNNPGKSQDNGAPGDADLSAIIGGVTCDASILEFDFKPSSDTIKFRYTFGSEEYREYVCDFNDVFAFLLSGPKPGGGNYVKQNVALVPGTTDPVSIKNVNNGDPNSVCVEEGNNSGYYIDNGTGNCPGPPQCFDVTVIQYDGFTVVFTAFAAVVPCEWYHIKLAIADAVDRALDSGVFLEANSFGCEVDSVISDFASSAPECAEEGVNFLNLGSTGPGVSYHWDFGSSATPDTSVTENPANIIFSTPGIKQISLKTIINCGSDSATTTKYINILEKPTASFTSTAPVCVNSVVSFTNTGSTGIKWSYTWDFGAGANPPVSTMESPVGIDYTSVGKKVITFTISDGNCTATTTDTITILETPTADFTSTAPVCTGDTIYFNNTGTSGLGQTYNWDFGSDATPATSNLENPVGVVYSNFGNRKITLIVTNSATLCQDTIIKYIVVNEQPISSFTSSVVTECENTSIDFTNTGSTGIKWSYTWDFGAGAVPNNSNAENPTGIIYNNEGIKTITLTISSNSCTNTYTNTINIYALPDADAGLDTTICANRSVQIGSSNISGNSYLWFPPSTLNDPTISDPIASPVANITIYSVIVTDSITGCQNADTITVTMLAPAIADAGYDVEICIGETVQIGSALIEGQTYVWTPIIGLSNPCIPTPLASPDTTTLYTVKANYKNCDTVTDNVVVTVHSLPDADAGEDVIITEGNFIQLNASGGVIYEWTPQTGLDNPMLYNPFASPDSTTIYYVDVTGIFGCTNTDSVTVIVLYPNLFVPNSFIPNSSGKNDVFRVRGSALSDFEMIIFDRSGEQVFYTRDFYDGWDGTRQITGEEMSEGAYIYSIKGIDENQEPVLRKGIVNLIR